MNEDGGSRTMAIISLVLGIIGIVGACCGGVFGGIFTGLPALILGWIARKKAIEYEQEGDVMNMAMAGLILGILEVMFGVLGFIFMFLCFGGSFFLGLLSETTTY